VWCRAEYLVWATNPLDLPALVTTSPLGTAGLLGEPDTSVLFGNEGVNDGMTSGGRITLGFWWDLRQVGGIQATYFGLVDQNAESHSARQEEPIIARPYLDVDTGHQASELVTYSYLDGPSGQLDVLDGQIDVRACTRLQGAEVLLRHLLCCRDSQRLDLLSGYRFGQLFDRLTIQQGTVLEGNLGDLPADYEWLDGEDYLVGSKIERFDAFESRNDFHGAELGLVGRWGRGRWSVEVLGKVALGRTWTSANVGGATTLQRPDPDNPDTVESKTFDYGLLALPTNIGHYTSSEFTVLSELGVSLRYHLTYYTRLSVGYDLLGWNQVSRAPELIDLGLDPSQIPPALGLTDETRPEFRMTRSDFWAQGLNFRLECQF
jgi:hypothetical protein